MESQNGIQEVSSEKPTSPKKSLRGFAAMDLSLIHI